MTRFRRQTQPVRHALSALVLFTPLFIARAALAQEACGEQTCPKGFTCETQSGGCPAVECLTPPCEPCVPATELLCLPGPCSADADCAEGMACADVEQTTCTGGGTEPASCPEGSCSERAPEGTCSTTSSKQCLPRWALSCSVDADCGVGFKCEEQEQCSCPGSPGTGTGTPAAPTPTPAECTCAPSGQKACEAIRVACTSDAGCPSGWSCRDNPEGACWADSNGNSGCTPADPAKLCLPPFSDVLSGSGVGATTTADGSALPSAPSKASAASESSSNATQASGGCSVGLTPSRGSRDVLAWCLALGAALGLSRRARRARAS